MATVRGGWRDLKEEEKWIEERRYGFQLEKSTFFLTLLNFIELFVGSMFVGPTNKNLLLMHVIGRRILFCHRDLFAWLLSISGSICFDYYQFHGVFCT